MWNLKHNFPNSVKANQSPSLRDEASFTPLEIARVRSAPLPLTGFTLVELLVVIGILAILTAAVVVVLNPAQLIAQSRDTTRFSDMENLNKALSLYQTDGGSSFGTPIPSMSPFPTPPLLALT